jgi:hypothetical protein
LLGREAVLCSDEGALSKDDALRHPFLVKFDDELMQRKIKASGTPGACIVIDGHGSLLSGRRVLPDDAWEDQGGLHPGPRPTRHRQPLPCRLDLGHRP